MKTSTDYNEIAKEYQASKILPWRLYGEAFTYFKNMDDISGASVLDLACGDGFYTRQLKLKGATEVVGVDLSEEMIKLAVSLEENHPLNIKYQVGDAKNLQLDKGFDRVCSSYLLNYAKNEDELYQMAKVIADHLNSGGKFNTVNSNPDFRADKESMFHYGFTRENRGFNAGDPISYRFYQKDESYIEVINYHLEKPTHEEVLRSAGFTNIKWHPLEVSKVGKLQYGGEYWNNLIKYQPVVGLSCMKK